MARQAALKRKRGWKFALRPGDTVRIKGIPEIGDRHITIREIEYLPPSHVRVESDGSGCTVPVADLW